MNTLRKSIGPITTYTVVLATALLLGACSSDDAGQPGEQQDPDTGADARVDVRADTADQDTGGQDADADQDADDAWDTSQPDAQPGDADATDDASTADTSNPDADAGGGCPPELSSYPEWSEATDIEYFEDPDPGVYSEVFGRPFPANSHTTHLEMQRGTYAAIRFQTPSHLDSSHSGSWNSEKASSAFAIAPGPRILSVSRCPGDFDPANIADDCIKQLYTADSFNWTGPGHEYAYFQCELQPDTTYYLNIVYADSPLGQMPPNQSECGDAPACGSLLIPRSNVPDSP